MSDWKRRVPLNACAPDEGLRELVCVGSCLASTTHRATVGVKVFLCTQCGEPRVASSRCEQSEVPPWAAEPPKPKARPLTSAELVETWADEIDANAEWSGDPNIEVANDMRQTAALWRGSTTVPDRVAKFRVGRRGPWWARRFRPADPKVWEGDQA